jgi:hypothetical protein
LLIPEGVKAVLLPVMGRLWPVFEAFAALAAAAAAFSAARSCMA